MKQYVWWVIGIIVVVAIIVSATKQPESTQGPIKIGGLISLTGVAASFGEMAKLGMDLAVKEINAKGGIEDRMVEIVYEDDATDPKTAAGLYQKLTGINSVHAVIGSNFDFVTQPVFGLAKTEGVTVISPSNPRIAGTFDTNEHSFVMMSDFPKVIRGIASYLDTAQYNKMAIVRYDSAFSESIKQTLNEMIVAKGKPAVIDETYKEIANNDFRTVILKLKNQGVDLVFLDMIATDPVVFTRQAEQLNFHPKYVTHVGIKDALATKDVKPKSFEGMVVIDWDAVTDEFSAKFEKEYSMKPSKSAHRAYEAVYILAEAVANTKTPQEVSTYLETHSFDTPNGEFTFTKEHAAENTLIDILTIKNGVLVK